MGLRSRLSFKSESIYFVTTTVVKHAKIFVEDKYCDLLVKNIKHYQQECCFKILGYVIMPSHFHWIVEVSPADGLISAVMRDIKKYSAWDIMEELERSGKSDLLGLFTAEAIGLKDQSRKFWMRRFDDQVIRDTEMLVTKLTYIHENPVKARLVVNPEDYKYSSARSYSSDSPAILEVITQW